MRSITFQLKLFILWVISGILVDKVNKGDSVVGCLITMMSVQPLQQIISNTPLAVYNFKHCFEKHGEVHPPSLGCFNHDGPQTHLFKYLDCTSVFCLFLKQANCRGLAWTGAKTRSEAYPFNTWQCITLKLLALIY